MIVCPACNGNKEGDPQPRVRILTTTQPKRGPRMTITATPIARLQAQPS